MLKYKKLKPKYVFTRKMIPNSFYVNCFILDRFLVQPQTPKRLLH